MKVAIVTGVLGGIGKESALRLCGNGYAVVGMDIMDAADLSDFEKYEVVECTNCIHEISAPHIGTIELVSDSRAASILVRSTDGMISISDISVNSDGEETRETIEHLKLSGKDIPQ